MGRINCGKLGSIVHPPGDGVWSSSKTSITHIPWRVFLFWAGQPTCQSRSLGQRARAEAQAHVNTSNGESDWLLRAAALEHESDWQGLLQLSQQWVKSKPNDAGAWVDLGLAYSQLGQYSK